MGVSWESRTERSEVPSIPRLCRGAQATPISRLRLGIPEPLEERDVRAPGRSRTCPLAFRRRGAVRSGSVETSAGIEPARHAFAARAAQPVLLVESGRRESNSPHSRWQRDASPLGFVRGVRELGNDPSPLGWKPSVRPGTLHARSCSWRLHSPFRLGRALTPSSPHRDLVELLRRRGRGAPP